MASKINKSDILTILKSSSPVSGEALARRLRVSRQALHKQIRVLRVQGYPITGKPKAGYALDAPNDVLIAQEVEKALAGQAIGRKIFYYPKLGSTQDAAKELASGREAEGAVVVAEEQSGGRGRMGRAWLSDRGGLWVSVLLRPNLSPQAVPALSLAASMAIADAIASETGVSAGLKWPNDLWVNVGSLQTPIYKKVCGILTEMSAEADRVQWVVLGFGVNVNNSISGSIKNQAANIKSLSGETVARQKLLVSILRNLQATYDRFLKSGFSAFRKEYAERSVLRSQWVSLNDFGNSAQGEFVDVDEQGALILRLEDGSTRSFFAGDVTLKPAALAAVK